MKILKHNDGASFLDLRYPLEYCAEIFKGVYDHEGLAKVIAENGLMTYMVITCADMLADEHSEDPRYLHKTKHIHVCEALGNVRREMTNRYFKREELDALFKKYEFPEKEFNYKEDDGRAFKFRLEDELFSYQETSKLVEFMVDVMGDAKCKLDDDGYAILDDNDDPIPETDKAVVRRQEEMLLERFLIPKIHTSYDRVYNMPRPFEHWDYRSSWHQGFFVEIPEEKITIADKGGSGSSGARESNGRWAHTFATLATKHGIETPTFFMIYDKHNVWRESFRIDTFATLGRDLSGNYFSSREVMQPLFKDRVWSAIRNVTYEYHYEKDDGHYY
jgi:hypothetical protein